MNVGCNGWGNGETKNAEKLSRMRGITSSFLPHTLIEDPDPGTRFLRSHHLRSRNELATTDRELRLIARLAQMGEISTPNTG